MSEFKTTLDVRMLPESQDQSWILLAPLVYQSDVANMCITVPAGYVTNFVSFEALKNVGQRPAVVHDFLYSQPEFSRRMADAILREALFTVGVDEALVEAMWAAVRLFGGQFKA